MNSKFNFILKEYETCELLTLPMSLYSNYSLIYIYIVYAFIFTLLMFLYSRYLRFYIHITCVLTCLYSHYLSTFKFLYSHRLRVFAKLRRILFPSN